MNSWIRTTIALTPVIAFMWALFLIDLVIPSINLIQFGIEPRTPHGFIGIVISPFLHANFFHLASNTIPLLVLPVLISFSEGRDKMWIIFVLGIVFSGLITWLLSSSGIVIGASGVIFVMIGYMLFDCIFNPCIRSLIAGFITITLFGGSIFSVYHFAPNISFISHLGGLLVGAVLAKVYGAPIVSITDSRK